MSEIDLNEVINSIKFSTICKFLLKFQLAIVLVVFPVMITLYFIAWIIFIGAIYGGLLGIGSAIRRPAIETPTPTPKPKQLSENGAGIEFPQTISPTPTLKRKQGAHPKFNAEDAARLEYEALQQEMKKEPHNQETVIAPARPNIIPKR